MNRIWTDAERDYVRDNAGRLTDLQISVELSRITGRLVSLQAVRKQRQKMAIPKKHGRGVCEIAKPSADANRYRGLPLRITGAGTDEQGV